MRKLTLLNSTATPTAGRFAAVALACTLAAAGCTTNVNPGSGEPTRSGPAAGPANPSVTPGTSYPAEVPMSSSTTTGATTVVRNRAEFRTKYLGAADPALGSPAAAVATGQVTSQTPSVLSNTDAMNASLGQSSPSAAISDEASVVVAVPPTVTTAQVSASPGSTSGTIPLNQSTANAPPLSAIKAASFSTAMPVNKPATLALTPAVSTSAVPSPAKAGVVATSSRKTLTRTTGKHAVASTRVAAITVSHPPAAQIAPKRVARVHIVQSQNGEVIIEKKP